MLQSLLTALALFALPAFAAEVHFTTVFLDDEGVVYVGVKHGDNPGDAEVISFPFSSGVRTNIPLPEEIAHRDVIGLITEKKKLFVLTSGTGAKDDGPMLHMYDRGQNVWAKVGKVVCPAFTKVTLKTTQMIFSCEVGKTKRGKTIVQRKTIFLRKDHRIYRNGVWRFPEFMLRYKGRNVLLEGQAPVWDKLRLRTDSGEQRTITAKDLFQLPLPGAESKLLPEKVDSTDTATGKN